MTQLSCSDPNLAPGGCLQFHTGHTGVIESFNWQNTDAKYHLANQVDWFNQLYQNGFLNKLNTVYKLWHYLIEFAPLTVLLHLHQTRTRPLFDHVHTDKICGRSVQSKFKELKACSIWQWHQGIYTYFVFWKIQEDLAELWQPELASRIGHLTRQETAAPSLYAGEI